MLALVVGPAAWGCSSSAEPHAPPVLTSASGAALTAPNQICADWSPFTEKVDWYCEDSQNAARVYEQARAKAGNQVNTIAVWVLWPRDEGQEGDPDKVKGWFAQAGRVLAWAQAQPDLGLADRSIKAMKNGLERLTSSQQRLMNQQKGSVDDAVKAVQDKVHAQAGDPRKAALVDALADTKIKLGELRAILDRAKTALVALQPQYQSLVAEFQAYKATEGDVSSRLAKFAQDGSGADMARLAAVKVAVADYQRQLSTTEVVEHAVEMRAQLLAVQGQYEAAIDPYRDFMTLRGIPNRSFVDGALRSVGNMMAYCQSRQTATDEVFSKLVDGLRSATDALVELEADKATRDTLANARFVAASTAFLDQANARIAALGKLPPESPTLHYPLYMAQLALFTSFEEMESMCTQAALAASSWMTPGCNILQPSFDRARSWLADGLPGSLRLRLILLRRKRADENLCKRIETELDAGHLEAAVAAYDAAVQQLDPAPLSPSTSTSGGAAQ